jgi:hypothetical protein
VVNTCKGDCSDYPGDVCCVLLANPVGETASVECSVLGPRDKQDSEQPALLQTWLVERIEYGG